MLITVARKDGTIYWHIIRESRQAPSANECGFSMPAKASNHHDDLRSFLSYSFLENQPVVQTGKQSESKLERELYASNLRPMPDQGCGKQTLRTCFFTDEFAVFSYIKM